MADQNESTPPPPPPPPVDPRIDYQSELVQKADDLQQSPFFPGSGTVKK